MISLNEPGQPSPEDWHFVKELAASAKPHFRWNRVSARANEADLRGGVEIRTDFPDPGFKLETACDDLKKFFDCAPIAHREAAACQIILEKADTGVFESYRLVIEAGACRIQAGDTEGIRRGIYHLEDLLLGADGPFLPLGVIRRRPWLKSRISRCFFGPIKRPPLNRDELFDDVDYYPDQYLNKLAHEGVNGLWLTVEFRHLCETSFTGAIPGAEKRLNKLRATAEKCLRYGIKIYIFCIEPRAMAPDESLLLLNPVLKGTKAYNGHYCFCPFSETAQKYLYEATNRLFSRIPGLGGIINISFGERPTTCLSSDFGGGCPVCSRKTPGEIIAAALKPMVRGMNDAAPGAELISWLYVPENRTGFSCPEQMLDVAENLPENVILQYNFESGGGKEQLGSFRHAGDYWLSYVGPSDIFSRIAAAARTGGNAVSAKIQAGCSHEVATVPLVPVPGLLYRKYKSMRALGVSHVMQCWYFGNYPGVMNKAAGELAFEEFNDSEADFLFRLAAPEWGEYAGRIAETWAIFGDAYSHYPLENMFQYYGPMHDGVVWPLYLFPTDKPLAPTWKLEYGTSGDCYGECLGDFSLGEALSLCAEITARWEDGMRKLRELEPLCRDSEPNRKDISLAEALGVLFRSGYHILKFYALRDELMLSAGGERGLAILKQMREIAVQEIRNSEQMLRLCADDSRLGFHSEAEGYKYFPAKLDWRIRCLNQLLENDFPAVEQRLRAGKPPFPEKPVKSYRCNSGQWEQADGFSWKADYADGTLRISVKNLVEPSEGDLTIRLGTRRFHPPRRIVLPKRGTVEIPLTADRDRIEFNIFRSGNSDGPAVGWVDPKPLPHRLALGDYNPAAWGELILGEK